MSKITIIIEDDDELVEVLKDVFAKREIRPSVSDYARFFNKTCVGWLDADSEINLAFLREQERYATERLKAQGYLFLNDVYGILGMPRTKAGQVVGWVYDEKNPIGDNCVDFNIYADHNADFVNGITNECLIDFNVDGMILDRLP